MKINLLQILVVSHLLLVFLLTGKAGAIPIILLIIAFAIDYSTKIRSEIKNLMYVLAAISAFLPLIGIFLLYPLVGYLIKFRSMNFSYFIFGMIILLGYLLVYFYYGIYENHRYKAIYNKTLGERDIMRL